MSNINHLNSVYLNYLTPLMKWRILDLESLRRECESNPSYYHFSRVIRKMEKEKIVEAYRHRFNGKKYIFFSSFGERQVAGEKNATAISKDSLIHDLKVSEIAKNLSKLNGVDNVMLEHELQNKRDFRTTYKVIPDAIIELTNNNLRCNMVLELELTQKNKQRIKEKAKQFMLSSKYDYVIYIFSKPTMMKTYIEEISRTVGEKYIDRFLFATDIQLTSNETNLMELDLYQRGKKLKFDDFLLQQLGCKGSQKVKNECPPYR